MKFAIVKNRYKWKSFTNKTKKNKGRPGKQALKPIEAARSSKV